MEKKSTDFEPLQYILKIFYAMIKNRGLSSRLKAYEIKNLFFDGFIHAGVSGGFVRKAQH
jgi:hypothetical protein